MLRKQWDGFRGDKAEKSEHNADPTPWAEGHGLGCT